MNRYMKIAAALLVAGVLVTAVGCTRVDLREQDGVLQETVRLKGAKAAEVDLAMGPGSLTVTGGGDGLMEGEFRYSSARMEPEIDYRVDDGVGELDIRQGNNMQGPFDWIVTWDGGFRNEWNLAFGEKTPIDMRIALGAGDNQLDVGDLMLGELKVDTGAGNLVVDAVGSETLEEFRLAAGAGDMTVDLSSGSVLRDVDLDTGAGNVKLNLSGDDWEEDMDVKVTTGAGDMTLTLPSDVPVRISVDSGLGETKADGFRLEDGFYVNDAFGDSGPLIEIEIDHGLGNVMLVLE